MTAGELILRTYRHTDREQVLRLWQEAGLTIPANDAGRDIDRKVAFQPDLFLVAERDGALVGATMAGYEGHRGWIQYLGVSPACRRQGIGRALLAEAERRLEARGCPKINLMVRTTNLGVTEFYGRCGFRRDDVICMGKRLVDDLAAAPPAPVPPAISIRGYRESDGPLLQEAGRESVADVFRWLPWCREGYTLAEAEGYVAYAMAEWTAGANFHFAIEDQDGTFQGGCSLTDLGAMHLTGNVGYWVRSSAARRGVASAATRLVAEYAWDHTDAERLEILAEVDNIASRRVAEKAGALPEGIAHSRIRVHGRMRDVAVYALLRSVHGRPRQAP